MTILKFKEIENQYFLLYEVAGQKGFVRADLLEGIETLEKISHIHFREGLSRAQCLLEKSRYFDPEIARLIKVIDLWDIEGIKLKSFGDLYRFSGKNGEAIFSIAQTFIEMMNELDL